MAEPLILALDAGTTSVRAIAFSLAGEPVAMAQRPVRSRHPAPGLVEQDAGAIAADTRAVAEEVARLVGEARIAAIGIANQRETAIAWDRRTGAPLAPAIVWQDRRTADACAALRAEGHEAMVTERTGLLLDPYFSATKWAFLLRAVPAVRAAADRGTLALGTVDSWLLWSLTGGEVHATDPSNASRTLLMGLEDDGWDAALLRLFGVPPEALPAIRPSAGAFGETVFGRSIPVAGMAGDQQAASVGQACLAAGDAKSTYGTGIFLLAATGPVRPRSANRLVATRGCAPAPDYALEGSVFTGGDAVKWLRDRLGILGDAAETEALARSVASAGGVRFVPAFAGLGAPFWEPAATGLLTGITGATGRAEIARATLEAMGDQTADLLDAFAADGAAPTVLRVDGGMVANDWLCQDLADVLGLAVVRPRVTETTALGAAMLAAAGIGLFPDLRAAAAAMVHPDRRFEPAMSGDARAARRAAWARAIAQVKAGVPH